MSKPLHEHLHSHFTAAKSQHDTLANLHHQLAESHKALGAACTDDGETEKAHHHADLSRLHKSIGHAHRDHAAHLETMASAVSRDNSGTDDITPEHMGHHELPSTYGERQLSTPDIEQLERVQAATSDFFGKITAQQD